ncbi:MAG: hypothetical protein L3J39_06095 [Verrucomicrobiales bacterium]|nr:hypothetical protein [Verrucomicrobiales bacterium]
MGENKIIVRCWRPPFSVRFSDGSNVSATLEGGEICLEITGCDPLRVSRCEFLSNNHDFIIVRSSGNNWVKGVDGNNFWLQDSLILLGGKIGFVIRFGKFKAEVEKIDLFRDLRIMEFWVDNFFRLGDYFIYEYEEGIVVFTSNLHIKKHIKRMLGDEIIIKGLIRKEMMIEGIGGKRDSYKIISGKIGEKVVKVEIYDE